MAVFRLRFKQIHKFVKGVLFVFALFNLQGTAVRFAANLNMLPQRKPFVKIFFHLFWVFSVVCGPSSRFLTPFIGQLAYYNAAGSICQALFSLFFDLFFPPSPAFKCPYSADIPRTQHAVIRGINGSTNWCLKIAVIARPVRTLVVAIPRPHGTR